MLDSPVWDTWVSYAVKLRAGKEIGQEEENKLVVSVLREYYHNDDYLEKWLLETPRDRNLPQYWRRLVSLVWRRYASVRNWRACVERDL